MDSWENNVNDELDTKKTSPFLQFFAGIGGRIVLTVLFTVIIFGAIAFVFSKFNSATALIIMLPCAFLGWHVLTMITPEMFLFMSVAGWAVYFFVKASISMIIGVFVTPFWLGKKISNAVADIANETIKKNNQIH